MSMSDFNYEEDENENSSFSFGFSFGNEDDDDDEEKKKKKKQEQRKRPTIRKTNTTTERKEEIRRRRRSSLIIYDKTLDEQFEVNTKGKKRIPFGGKGKGVYRRLSAAEKDYLTNPTTLTRNKPLVYYLEVNEIRDIHHLFKQLNDRKSHNPKTPLNMNFYFFSRNLFSGFLRYIYEPLQQFIFNELVAYETRRDYLSQLISFVNLLYISANQTVNTNYTNILNEQIRVFNRHGLYNPVAQQDILNFMYSDEAVGSQQVFGFVIENNTKAMKFSGNPTTGNIAQIRREIFESEYMEDYTKLGMKKYVLLNTFFNDLNENPSIIQNQITIHLINNNQFVEDVLAALYKFYVVRIFTPLQGKLPLSEFRPTLNNTETIEKVRRIYSPFFFKIPNISNKHRDKDKARLLRRRTYMILDDYLISNTNNVTIHDFLTSVFLPDVMYNYTRTIRAGITNSRNPDVLYLLERLGQYQTIINENHIKAELLNSYVQVDDPRRKNQPGNIQFRTFFVNLMRLQFGKRRRDEHFLAFIRRYLLNMIGRMHIILFICINLDLLHDFIILLRDYNQEMNEQFLRKFNNSSAATRTTRETKNPTNYHILLSDVDLYVIDWKKNIEYLKINAESNFKSVEFDSHLQGIEDAILMFLDMNKHSPFPFYLYEQIRSMYITYVTPQTNKQQLLLYYINLFIQYYKIDTIEHIASIDFFYLQGGKKIRNYGMNDITTLFIDFLQKHNVYNIQNNKFHLQNQRITLPRFNYSAYHIPRFEQFVNQFNNSLRHLLREDNKELENWWITKHTTPHYIHFLNQSLNSNLVITTITQFLSNSQQIAEGARQRLRFNTPLFTFTPTPTTTRSRYGSSLSSFSMSSLFSNNSENSDDASSSPSLLSLSSSTSFGHEYEFCGSSHSSDDLDSTTSPSSSLSLSLS